MFLFTELLRKARSCYPGEHIWLKSIQWYSQPLYHTHYYSFIESGTIVLFFQQQPMYIVMVKSISAGMNFALCHVPLLRMPQYRGRKKKREFLYVDYYVAEFFILIPEPECLLSL